MATKKTTTAEEVVEAASTGETTETAAKTTKKAVKAASVYSAEELASNAQSLFGTRKECVAAALKSAKVTKCTIAEAKTIVDTFLKKEVK